MRKTLATIGATIALATGAACAGATVANQYQTGAVNANDTIMSGCVVRFSDRDGSPSIHANGAHLCAGVKDVSITGSGRLRVTQTVQDATQNPIIFAFIQTDETLSKRGIIAGASGGTGDTTYVFHDTRLGRKLDLSKRSDRMRLQGEYSNAWVGWVHAPVGG